MSIFDLAKIGDWIKRNQADIAIVVGFVLVALIAFGMGRLSALPDQQNQIIINEPATSGSPNLSANVSQSLSGVEQGTEQAVQTGEGMFVASKNSTKYHWPWCSYGEKIKEANRVWFSSEAEAQAAGYSPCSCILSKAPAGYVKP